MSAPTSSSSEASKAARKLGDLLAQLPLDNDDQWQEIAATAQHLANELRVKDGPVDNHTALGRTLLPQTLTSLLKSATTECATRDDLQRTEAIYEILRVGANLCMDHNENRGFLLDAGFAQSVVSLLEGYNKLVPANYSPAAPLPISIHELKVVKTAIGVLLNMTIGFEPVKSRLISLKATTTIISLSLALYPPCSWQRSQSEVSTEDQGSFLESWSLRSGLSGWAWRAISELREDVWQSSSADVGLLSRSLLAFVPPYPDPPPIFASEQTEDLRSTLVQADFECLEEICSLLESMILDLEEVRVAFAKSFSSASSEAEPRAFPDMLAFIENADYPPVWDVACEEGELEKMKRNFGICKAAIIKSVVETAAEEKNAEILWAESDEDGSFVQTMVGWIREYKNQLGGSQGRDDLIICATLSLGNLVRQETHSSVLINEPIALGPDLATLLEPDTSIKVKHGVVGLLKNLSQTSTNKTPLGKAGIVQRLARSQVWDQKSDIAEIVEVAAIGVAKHLCNGDVENCFFLVLPSDENGLSSESTGLTQILALVGRSDSIAVKSEGTRVLVNVIKTLWSSSDSDDDTRAQRRQEAMRAVTNSDCVAALAQLIARSRKYPILINEGTVALSLLTMRSDGGKLVLDALTNPLPPEVSVRNASAVARSIQSASSPTSGSAGSNTSSPVVSSPNRALDMLLAVLRNKGSPPFPAEIRANVCSLLGQLGKKSVIKEEDGRQVEVERMKEETRELIQAAADSGGQSERNAGLLSSAARKALDNWSAS